MYTYNSQNKITSWDGTDISPYRGVLTTSNYSYQFSYDNLDRLNSFSYQSTFYSGKPWTIKCIYAYNELNQLQNISFSDDGYNYKKEYYYDSLGNIIEYRGGCNNKVTFHNYYSYNELNQISSFRCICYLENGNVMSDNSYSFSFDEWGNIESAVITKNYMNKSPRTSTVQCQNLYDEQNRLVARTVVYPDSGTTYTYVYEYYN